MDVERIQKINMLAVDLMRRGLASDREDAVKQAEAVYHNRDPEGFDSIRETMAGVKEEARRAEGGNVAAGDNSDLSSEKVKDILEKNTKYIITQLRAFQEKVEAMDKEIVTLRSQFSSVRASAMNSGSGMPVSSAGSGDVRIQSASPERPVSVPASAQGSGGGSSSTSHPRSGNYNVGDVSIEKFFYAGHK